jgi:hypothetical protein
VVNHIKGESKLWTGLNGDFERSAEICNHRAVYTHTSVSFSMWWAKLSVCKDGNLDDDLCGVGTGGNRKEVMVRVFLYKPIVGKVIWR